MTPPNRLRLLLPLVLCTVFVAIQFLVSVLANAGASVILGEEAAVRMSTDPNWLLLVVAMAQIAALSALVGLGRPLFMPAACSRTVQLRVLAAVIVPVILLTLGVQLLESGAIALLNVDLGRYEELSQLILQADLPVVIVCVVLIPGVVEELIFRDIIQPATTWTLGPIAGIAYTAILFGLVHIIAVQVFAATLFGVVFGYLRYRCRSVYPSIFAHMTANAIVIAIGRASLQVDGAGEIPPLSSTAVPVALVLVGTILATIAVMIIEQRVRRYFA